MIKSKIRTISYYYFYEYMTSKEKYFEKCVLKKKCIHFSKLIKLKKCNVKITYLNLVMSKMYIVLEKKMF